MHDTDFTEFDARFILREVAQDLARQRGQRGPVRPRYCVGTAREELAAVELLLSEFPLPERRMMPQFAQGLARAIIAIKEPETTAEPQAIQLGSVPKQTATRRRVRA
ncbi:MAG: hypothetical protein SFX18_08720 [Pirellulales bacterium]|nr:hypothetical protein [Pirellulales bacterium]